MSICTSIYIYIYMYPEVKRTSIIHREDVSFDLLGHSSTKTLAE